MPRGWRKPSAHLQPVAQLRYTGDAQGDPFGAIALGRDVDGSALCHLAAVDVASMP
jgi:hypothetical protein